MPRSARGTLVEIFSIENRWVRLSEICNHIIAKVDRRGAGCLTTVEHTIDRVNDFEYRMIQGGLSGLLYADWLDWGAIREVATSDVSRLLEFEAGEGRGRVWRARIEGDRIVFNEVRGPGRVIGMRATTQILVRPAKDPKAPREAEISVGATSIRVRMSADALRALAEWKAGRSARKAA